MATVFLTGANRGIGLALTKAYLEDNWQVVATCRSPEAAEPLRQLLHDYPEQLTLHPLDVTNTKQLESISAVLADTPLDVVINNAGVFGDHSVFGEIDYEKFEEVLRINTLAPLRITEKLIGNLERGAQKKLVNLTSKMGSVTDNGSGGRYSYRASKAALNMITKSLAIDLEPSGITAIVIHPGWVRTDMGGAGATRSPEESALGIKKVIDSLSPADSGKFFQFDGIEIPW